MFNIFGTLFDVVWTIVKLIFERDQEKRKKHKEYLKKITKRFREKSKADEMSKKGYEEEKRLKEKYKNLKKGN